ncbi:hypothetical protein ACWIE7_13365 [Dietzia sp. NPDC055343]
MNDVTQQPIAERVRTVLARGAVGTIEAGILRRPLRSARVRDDGVVVLVVDVNGMSRAVGDEARVAAVGASATVEIVDSVCAGRCRGAAPRPSFALDGRQVARPEGCDDDCAVIRGVVTMSGIVTASSDARRRRLVAADGGSMSPAGGLGSMRLSELQPLEITYLGSDGVDIVSRAELAAAPVDPIGVDEQAWLRRIGADAGWAARLALRAGRQIAGTNPRIVGVDGRGLDLDVASVGGGFREVVRVPFSQVCLDSETLRAELELLDS